jgi:hypothetical protein
MNFYLYVLQLKGEKYFLHYSIEKDDKEIINECVEQYSFVRNNQPAIIVNVDVIKPTENINSHVKCKMICFGIENVRGGSYSDEILSVRQIKCLTEEFMLGEKYMNEKTLLIDNLQQICNRTPTNEEIEKEESFISMSKEKYNLYNTFELNDKTIKFDRSVVKTIVMFQQILYSIYYENLKVNDDILSLYKEFVQLLKMVNQYHYEIIDQEKDSIFFLMKPDLLLDVFFCENVENTNDFLHRTYEYTQYMLKTYESMSYKILNYLAELSFDIHGKDLYFQTPENENLL